MNSEYITIFGTLVFIFLCTTGCDVSTLSPFGGEPSLSIEGTKLYFNTRMTLLTE
jgi:hypothetical protein